MDHLDLLRTLLEPSRVAVVGAIATSARTADDIAEVTGVSHREVVRTLGPLVHAGYVRRDGTAYRLVDAAWRAVARELPQAPPVHPRIGFGMTDEERDVLARFFQGEHLRSLPAQRSKRLVVLERLALEFEPGQRFPEPEVNRRLARFNPDDPTSLRRALVDEGFLDREPATTDNGRSTVVYWRAGGRL